jgi:argininosuccinate lyase
MAKVATGRALGSSKLLDEFNASLMFDKELYKEDIKGSLAHASMLNKQGILTNKELEDIKSGLTQVEKLIDSGEFEFNLCDEDIHMTIEKKLTELIGQAGKKLHTARSRNDQVATDFRLYVQKQNIIIKKLLFSLMQTLLKLSKEHTDTLLPGMTHLQHAQPINFAYHLLAYFSMFKRDFERFDSSYKRNNISPLGCAALAGTPYPIDREETSKTLGFDHPSINCLDTVSDRDFALEILFNISTLMMHISRLSEELILWGTSEFNFVVLSDDYSTSSSIMPQKKNPDVPELLRGKTGRVYGNLVGLLTVMKGLPLAYNKDTQEDKEGVFDSVKTATISLTILNEVLKTMTVNKDAMKKATKKGHLSATDLADHLVNELGYAFRDAYKLVGQIVDDLEKKGKDISDITLEELQEYEPKLDKKVLEKLDLKNSMNSRNSFGGTSENATKKQIEIYESWINEIK